MKPLTILFNTYPVAFDCPGGGEVQLQKYEQYLTELGVSVLRYDPWNPHPQFDVADVVHYFSVQVGSLRFCEHVVYERKLPLVVSTIAWMEPEKRQPPWESGKLLEISTRNLPNSFAERDQLCSIYGVSPDKFIPIVNGVDEIFFEPISPDIFRKHFNIYEPFVLCMGNIERRKNQLSLIKALKGTGIHLVLAGQDREVEYAAACRATADETVHFVSVLEHGSELHRSAYSACDALALPSTMETPGLAALEAGAAGVRLVLTEVGCTEEYFKNHACYVNPDDVSGIRDGVLKTLRCPQRNGIKQIIKNNYTWRIAAKQLIAVYTDLLSIK